MKFIWTLILLTLSLAASAEYRVYQYFVRSSAPYSLNKDARLITSTLDPVSYLAYHGGRSSIQVDLLRSWMCKGHTGQTPTCDAPLKSAKLEEIRSEGEI